MPADVYHTDTTAIRDRIPRLEQHDDTADQRGWHIRTALTLSVAGAVLSLAIAAVLAAVGLD